MLSWSWRTQEARRVRPDRCAASRNSGRSGSNGFEDKNGRIEQLLFVESGHFQENPAHPFILLL